MADFENFCGLGGTSRGQRRLSCRSSAVFRGRINVFSGTEMSFAGLTLLLME